MLKAAIILNNRIPHPIFLIFPLLGNFDPQNSFPSKTGISDRKPLTAGMRPCISQRQNQIVQQLIVWLFDVQ